MQIITIVCIILCIICSVFLAQKYKQYNELQTKIISLKNEIHTNSDELFSLNSKLEGFNEELEIKSERLNSLNTMINDKAAIIKQQSQAIDALHNQYASLSNQIDQSIKNKKALAEKNFLDFQKQQQEDTDKFIAFCEGKKQIAADSLNELQSKEAAAVEAAKRKMADEQQESFYHLLIEASDKNDDEELQQFQQQHDNKLSLRIAIGKVRWACIWSKAYTDLIGRLFGDKRPCGIYKITNTKNQMCYVGQAVNIPDRWSQHIKRALGAEPRTANKLYPAMELAGLDVFTFEVIEECDRSMLNSREDYWQDYFKAKEFGYSMR